MSEEVAAVILATAAEGVPPGEFTGHDVLVVLCWMVLSAVGVCYAIGVCAFAEALRDEIILTEPDRTLACWVVGIWWPVFAFFRGVEWCARRWREKSWP